MFKFVMYLKKNKTRVCSRMFSLDGLKTQRWHDQPHSKTLFVAFLIPWTQKNAWFFIKARTSVHAIFLKFKTTVLNTFSNKTISSQIPNLILWRHKIVAKILLVGPMPKDKSNEGYPAIFYNSLSWGMSEHKKRKHTNQKFPHSCPPYFLSNVMTVCCKVDIESH